MGFEASNQIGKRTQFRPGQSGNPGGRPAGAIAKHTKVLAALEAMADTLSEPDLIEKAREQIRELANKDWLGAADAWARVMLKVAPRMEATSTTDALTGLPVVRKRLIMSAGMAALEALETPQEPPIDVEGEVRPVAAGEGDT